MEVRTLQDMQASSAEDSLFALSIVTLGVVAGFAAFISFLWTPRLRGCVEVLVDSCARGLAALQGICVLAYVPVWSKDSYDYLRAAECWIWVDYFDDRIGDEIDNPSSKIPPSDLFAFSSHWSPFYFENCFTSTTFLLLALLCSCLLIAIRKLTASCMPFHGLDVFIRVLQIVHLRLSVSLLIEVRMLQDGKDFDWSSGLAVGISSVALFVVPFVQLVYLRLKHRGNLENEDVLNTFGAAYREFRPCWQVFHFHMNFVENLALAVAICILGQWSDVQPYVIFATLLLSFIHTVAARPFKDLTRNMEEAICKCVRLLLGALLVVAYNKNDIDLDNDTQSLLVFLLILLWLLCRLTCGVYLACRSVLMVRRELTNAPAETKKLGSEKTLGSILKTAASDDSPRSKRRSKKTASLSPDVSANEEGSARTDLMEISTTPLPSKDDKEEIDPRLDRKNGVRRRRKKKVSIPA